MPQTDPLRFLIAESEPPSARAKRRDSVGRSSGETYQEMLGRFAPGSHCTILKPADGDEALPEAGALEGYDAAFLTGSPLHLYQETPETRRAITFMRALFASGTPSFGSCAGLQIAVVAAGGTVRPMGTQREAGFARRIVPTEAGRGHPLLHGRPAAFDAPAIHTDEVERLPDGATLLATNRTTAVQAAEIVHDGGRFWGVQYHPELSLFEVAGALRRQADDLVEAGLADTETAVAGHADLIEALDAAPERRDLRWRLGVDEQLTDAAQRSAEIRNFINLLVRPHRSARGRA